MPRHRREGVHARGPRGSATCQPWDGWRTPPAPHVHVTAVWRLDLGTQRLLRHGRVRELTALQFRLLAHFVRNPDVT